MLSLLFSHQSASIPTCFPATPLVHCGAHAECWCRLANRARPCSASASRSWTRNPPRTPMHVRGCADRDLVMVWYPVRQVLPRVWIRIYACAAEMTKAGIGDVVISRKTRRSQLLSLRESTVTTYACILTCLTLFHLSMNAKEQLRCGFKVVG